MSFDMETATPTYAVPPNVCNPCFGMAQTPNYVLVFYSGIQIGALWDPGDPPAPNILYVAPIIAPCHFKALIEDFEIEYQFVGGRTHCTLTNAVVGLAFSSNIVGVCHIWCANDIVNPAISKYYGGHCIAVAPLDGDSWNYPELMDLISDHPDWARYLNARSAAGMNVFYNLYKGNSQVNIKIKIDHS